MSGQGRYRDMWDHYVPDADGIVFVIDATDKARICVAKDELEILLSRKAGHWVSIESEIETGQSRECIGGFKHSRMALRLLCRASNALTGQGVGSGIDWLQQRMQM
ncbi:hypothetical protein HK101_011511 [Irineochytrium annulatum]|nr:hypothetical protein HK101_011511 [Irineochytrium annulatum]